MKHFFISFLLVASILYSQTTEIYVPDVDGTEYNGQLVKVWDANSGEYYGEEFTTNSLAVFDNITSVKTDPVKYAASAGYNPQRKTIYFTSSKSGKVSLIVSDILGQSRKVESYSVSGREEIKLSKLGLDNFSNGFYGVRIITPSESYTIGFIKNGLNYSATNAVTAISGARLKKTTLADEIKVEVTHEGHYKRTFTAEKSERIEDYVVEYVDQLKTDGTPVTPEEFKQYCFDFNFANNNGMGEGLKSFFPNPDKQIWIASRNTLDSTITFTYEQMESIRDLVIEEIYPYIKVENQPSFYLDDPANPEPIPLQETGKIVVFPTSAGYFFGVGGDPGTGVIKYGAIGLDDDLDIADTTTQSRKGTLEEVASCLIGPRGTQGPPYDKIQTIFVGGGKIYPVDSKLLEMGQQYQPKEQLDNVLGL